MTRLPPAFLGIDAGGTKAAWLVLAGDAVQGEGSAGPIQVAALGVREAAVRLGDVIAEAGRATGSHFAAVVAGLAGAGRADARQALSHELTAAGVQVRVQLAGDVVLAAAAALADGPGVALWAGTGSFAVARDTGGRLHRVGGRGSLLGDHGSAHDLARRAAAAVVGAADGLGEETELTRLLPTALGVGAPLDLVPRLQGEPAGTIASLYPCVRRAADAGDRVAAALRAAGAEALAKLALAAGRRAGLPTTTLRVLLGGGVLVHDAAMRALVGTNLAAAGVGPAPELSARTPARGAAELARAVARGTLPLSQWMDDHGLA